MMNLADYQPPFYLISHVDMRFALEPDATQVEATLHVRRAESTPTGTPLVLDAENLTLLEVRLDGILLSPDAYTLSEETLTVHHVPQDAFSLSLCSQVAPAKNTELSGLYLSGGVYTTQCEAVGFRRIIPFLDRPDVLATYRVRIEAPVTLPVLLSNGNPCSAGLLDKGRHYAEWHDPHPKPSYLFALVAGDLDSVQGRFTTREGRDVALNVYTVKGQGERAAFALEALKSAMRFDEDAYQRCYDLDVFNIVAVPDFNMGAMENKGLNIFNDKYILADPFTATDTDFMNVDAIVAHEYFHNWTGNRITCRDWFQLCLKEGLTVYREQMYMAARRGEAVARISDIRRLRAQQFAEDAGPLAHPVRPAQVSAIDNLYTATVYEKGAELVRVLRAMIGEKAFDEGLQLYFSRHDGQAVTIEDFLQCFHDVGAHQALSMMAWYQQAGTPQLDVRLTMPSTSAVQLELAQSYPTQRQMSGLQPLPLPLRLALVDCEGCLSPQSLQILMNGHHHTLTLPWSGSRRPVISMNQGFLIPMTVVAHDGIADPHVLLERDDDPVNRWLAAQDLMMTAMMHHYKTEHFADFAPLAKSLAALLDAPTLNDGLKAEFLVPPSETELARHVGDDVDPAKVYAARKALRLALGQHLAPSLHRHYQRTKSVGFEEAVGDIHHVQARQLAHVCLDLMVLAGAPEALNLARAHYAEATNLTSRLAALTTLYRQHAGSCQDLQHFETLYEKEALVMDKWFALQAGQPDVTALETCQSLLQHPLFSWTNPNRFRSVVAVFAQANMVAFHRPDGAGYEFVLDCIARIDGVNPQVAARLMTAFNNWRYLEPKRRKIAHAQLSDFSKRKSFSKDTADILHRLVGE